MGGAVKKWPFKVAISVAMLIIAAGIGQRDKREPALRIVHGTVVDSQRRALASSVVYLHHQATNAVKTQIADSYGRYRFSGLDPQADYKIHAEHGEWTSSSHALPAQGKREVVVHLKVDQPKTHLSLENVPNDLADEIAD
jgi:protocatechuate 3,4-dioxygenase beta subunit